MRSRLAALALSFYSVAPTSVAFPQLQRTWVSSGGSDIQPCTHEFPCATFAEALTRTAAGGEIDVLDAGSFGQVTITKPVTIDGTGLIAAINVCVGCIGISVITATNDVVILRGLTINGFGTGGSGIFVSNPGNVIIEDVKVVGFASAGVAVGPKSASAAGSVVIRNSTLADNYAGVSVRSGNTSVIHSVLTGNAHGLLAFNDGIINADDNLLTGNSIAVRAGFVTEGGPPQAGSMVRLSNNDVYGNGTGFMCDGGMLASNGSNRKGSNPGTGGPACAPSATITQQ